MTQFAYELDQAEPKRLGLIVLQTDETIEQDFRRLIPAEVSLHVTRVPSGLEVTPETLASMKAHIPQAAHLFPGAQRFDVIGYGCTSGTATIGVAAIETLVKSAIKTDAVTEPVSALVAACRSLGVKKLAFLSPYIETVSANLRDVLSANGVETPTFGSFNEAEEAKVVRISGLSVIDAACALQDASDADATFLSCTNLRTLDVIDKIEQRTGKPVLSSNQVLAWDMCRRAGLTLTHPGCGKLLSGV